VGEKLLLRAMNGLDRVICMGNRAVQFYQSRGVSAQFEVIPGGIDAAKFSSAETDKEYDIIFVGRLAPVKRVDLLLEAIRKLADMMPDIRVVIVGTGELEGMLKEMAQRLQITKNVVFVGHQDNVTVWLHKSRTFVLTSDSEGLSLAMMEALTCGLPCVVSDVGELGEIIVDGQNGRLVQERTGAAFADAFRPLLAEPSRLASMSLAARSSADAFEIRSAAGKWDRILRDI
jgi:L-malate glycosyltransferase